MEFVIALSISMIWIVVIILLILASFGYGLKCRGFAADHSALTALPMSEITFKEYYSRKDEHPIVDESLAKKSKIFAYISCLAAVLLIVFIVLAICL